MEMWVVGVVLVSGLVVEAGAKRCLLGTVSSGEPGSEECPGDGDCCFRWEERGGEYAGGHPEGAVSGTATFGCMDEQECRDPGLASVTRHNCGTVNDDDPASLFCLCHTDDCNKDADNVLVGGVVNGMGRLVPSALFALLVCLC